MEVGDDRGSHGGASSQAVSLFCRHNRFVADCPICSKGTVLEAGAAPPGAPRHGGGARTAARRSRRPRPSGPQRASAGLRGRGRRALRGAPRAGPGRRPSGRVGGLALRRRAPVLARADLTRLAGGAHRRWRRATPTRWPPPRPPAGERPPPASGRQPGRTGDFKEELRVEPMDDGRVRVARWVLRPGAGWQLQDAPPMLPATRYAEALAALFARDWCPRRQTLACRLDVPLTSSPPLQLTGAPHARHRTRQRRQGRRRARPSARTARRGADPGRSGLRGRGAQPP